MTFFKVTLLALELSTVKGVLDSSGIDYPQTTTK